MAAEFQRSEIMSGAPSSSESVSPRPAQADVSADAALILAALGRMEAVVRDERAAFTRLRAMLGEMAQAIARGKAVADSETAATLLDELEHRVDAMLDIAGPGPVAEAAAIPDQQPPAAAGPVEAQAIQHPAGPDQVPTVSDVVSRFGSDDEPPPAAAAPQPVEDTATGAPTVAMLTAMVEALRDSISPAPEPEAALESPTPQAADFVTQPLEVAPQPETSAIGNTEVATTTAEAAHLAEPSDAEVAQAAEATYPAEATEAADIPPPAEPKPDNSAFVAMLRARLAELKAAEVAAAPEPAVTEVAAQLSDAAPPPEASAIDGAETVAPTAEIVDAAEPEHFTEAPEAEASQAIEAMHTEAAADVPPPADPAPDNSAFVAMLNARLAALQAAAEHGAPLEAPQATPPSEAIQTDVGEAAPIPGPAVTGLHESALLASLEQMGARPFPPPDEGTAVIFAPKPEFEFLPEFVREPAASTEPPSEPEQAIAPQPATAVAETPSAAVAPDVTQKAPSEAAAASETAESDFDPADFLFGPEPEPDPAAFLLDPAPPQPPASPAKPSVVAPPAKPAAENSDTAPPAEPDPAAHTAPEPAPHDPLRALKALSENEKLALFS